MERSLSILLPVHNGQSTLSARVRKMLEIAAELTKHFEVIVIDDGSTDATIEVADELAIRYPQVAVRRHRQPLGRVAALKTGLKRSWGEVLFFEDEDCELPINQIRTLWQAMDNYDVVLGCRTPPAEAKWSNLRQWQQLGQAGFQMVSRQAIAPILRELSDETAMKDALTELGQTWHEIKITQHALHDTTRRSVLLARQLYQRTKRPDSASPRNESARPERPNYLTRLKDFAWGE